MSTKYAWVAILALIIGAIAGFTYGRHYQKQQCAVATSSAALTSTWNLPNQERMNSDALNECR